MPLRFWHGRAPVYAQAPTLARYMFQNLENIAHPESHLRRLGGGREQNGERGNDSGNNWVTRVTPTSLLGRLLFSKAAMSKNVGPGAPALVVVLHGVLQLSSAHQHGWAK